MPIKLRNQSLRSLYVQCRVETEVDEALTDRHLRGEPGAVISDLACFLQALAIGHRARYKKPADADTGRSPRR